MKKTITISAVIIILVLIGTHSHLFRTYRLQKLLPVLERYKVESFYINDWGEQDKDNFKLNGSCNAITYAKESFTSDSCYLNKDGNFDDDTQEIFNKIKYSLLGTNVNKIYYINYDNEKISSATFDLKTGFFASGYPTYVYNMPLKGPPGGQPKLREKVINEDWKFIVFN